MALHLRSESLDWALKHIDAHGDTDLFPRPFEFSAIAHCWEPGRGYGEIKSRGVRELLRAYDLSSWSLRPQRRCITPKNRYGFRIGTQLDPLDSLFFNGIVYEIGEEIEAARVAKDRNVVHSYRFKPSVDGDMFDRGFGYRTFLRAVEEKSSEPHYLWIVTADIADFYPRIYSHPLENALSVSVGSRPHTDALVRFLGQLNQSVSYGLPVGPSASRLLAELVISDVDRLLLSDGVDFVRFVDDYRIFCRTERDAYDALAKLANALFDAHGLTLQQHKTAIFSKDEYLRALAPDEEDLERTRLSEEFDRIVEEMGLDDPYDPIEYDALDPVIKGKVDRLNLRGILDEQVALGIEANALTLKFLFRRLGQLGDYDVLEDIIANPRALYLVLRDFAAYAVAAADSKGADLGRNLLELLHDDVLGHLDFNRAWMLSPFTQRPELNCVDRLLRLLAAAPSQLERRELLLSLGSHGASDWISSQRRNYDQESPWCRRAFLASARAMPGDQAGHWYKAIRPQLDVLEQSVTIWAESL